MTPNSKPQTDLLEPSQRALLEAFSILTDQIAEQVAAKLAALQPEPNRLLTPKQAAERLGLSDRAARDLTYSHHGQPPQLPTVRLGAGGGSVRIEENEVDALIERRREGKRR